MSDAEPGRTLGQQLVYLGSCLATPSRIILGPSFCLVLAWLENPGEDVIHQRGGQRRARRGLEAHARPKVGRGCARGPGTGREDVWRRQRAECGVGAGERKKKTNEIGVLWVVQGPSSLTWSPK